MAGPDVDVVIVGDGPAGLALAAAASALGLSTVVVGEDRPWGATYGAWRDDVPDVPDACFASIVPSVVVHGHRRHALDRPYGVVDNAALRAHLGDGLRRERATADGVQHFRWGSRVLTTGHSIDARHVVDASGSSPALLRHRPGDARRPVPGQSAWGTVVATMPSRFDDDSVTLMDLRPPLGETSPPTFGYVVPTARGWLVEETVLVARPIVDPATLRPRLAARLGTDVADGPDEVVVIPMDRRLPWRRDPIIGFGAAAGFVHPATGFSVAAALRAAPRVATALADATAAGRPDARSVWDAVWPRPLRSTRRLHNHGQRVLLALDTTELARFFDAFFELPVERWRSYLRIDSPPGEVSRTMLALARRLPWSMRRHLLG
ncbi:MAG: lycopene cyclase family protein [Acidimicrobiia bacterium]|nr:lycopene cyclase family protein [Acidimicrobiia bacterium]